MNKLSQLAESLVGSEIIRLGNAVNERIRQGEKIYNFTIGDFDPKIFPIPKELETLIIQSYQKHYTNYPPAEGVPELREAVSKFLKEWEGLDYATNEIQISCGGRPLIYALFKTVVDADDKVIYAVPSWNNNHYVNMNRGRHEVVETTPGSNFMPTANDIAPHISGTSLICLCTPQNPTGTTLSKNELEKICDLIIEENNRRSEGKRLYLMFDQIYWTLTYGDTKHYNPVELRPEMKNFTIFIDGISKAFASTGVRVGWACGPAYVLAKMKALLGHIGGWAPMAEQKAAAQYLVQNDAIKSHLVQFKSAIEERLRKIYNCFIELKSKGFNVDAIAPQAAIYLTVKFDLAGKKFNGKLLQTQSDVTDYILSEAKMAVVPFYAFGADRQSPWYRLSVGTCKLEEIDEVFAKLEKVLSSLE